MNTTSRGDMADVPSTDPIDGDVRVPLLHASQPSNLILEYYTNTRSPRALGLDGLSAARAVANPQHPSQELIEALNRNIYLRLHGLTRDLTPTSQCEDDREQEYRKLKDAVLLHLSDDADRDHGQELQLAQEYQQLHIQEENVDSTRSEDDVEMRDTLVEDSMAHCNGMQTDNEALSSSIAITSMLSHLTSNNSKLKSQTLNPEQQCDPQPPDSVRINGDKSPLSYVMSQKLCSEDQNTKHELELESGKNVNEIV